MDDSERDALLIVNMGGMTTRRAVSSQWIWSMLMPALRYHGPINPSAISAFSDTELRPIKRLLLRHDHEMWELVAEVWLSDGLEESRKRGLQPKANATDRAPRDGAEGEA